MHRRQPPSVSRPEALSRRRAEFSRGCQIAALLVAWEDNGRLGRGSGRIWVARRRPVACASATLMLAQRLLDVAHNLARLGVFDVLVVAVVATVDHTTEEASAARVSAEVIADLLLHDGSALRRLVLHRDERAHRQLRRGCSKQREVEPHTGTSRARPPRCPSRKLVLQHRSERALVCRRLLHPAKDATASAGRVGEARPARHDRVGAARRSRAAGRRG